MIKSNGIKAITALVREGKELSEQEKEIFVTAIRTVDDLSRGIKENYLYLQKFYVLRLVRDSFNRIINTAKDLGGLLYECGEYDEDCYGLILGSMKDRLPNIIKTTPDLKMVLDWNYRGYSRQVIDMLKDHLPNIIKTPMDVENVLARGFSPCPEFILDIMKDHLPNIIKTEEERERVISGCECFLPNGKVRNYLLPFGVERETMIAQWEDAKRKVEDAERKVEDAERKVEDLKVVLEGVCTSFDYIDR